MPDFRAAIVRASGRDQPGAARSASARRSAACDVPVYWHASLDEVPDGPDDHPRQRVLRRAAGASGRHGADGWHERVVEHRRRTASCMFSIARDPIPLFERVAAERPARRARSARSSNGAPTTIALELGRRVVARSAAPRWSSTTAMSRARIGDTLQAVGSTTSPIRSPRPGLVDLTAHVDFQALAQAAESMGARVARADRAGRVPAPARHRERAPRALKARAASEQATDDRRRARRA